MSTFSPLGPFGDWNESGIHLTKGYLFRAHLSWTQTNFIGNVRSRHSHDDDAEFKYCKPMCSHTSYTVCSECMIS